MADIGQKTAPAGSAQKSGNAGNRQAGASSSAPQGRPPEKNPGSNVRDFNAARRQAEIGRVQQARHRHRAGNYLIYYILLGIIMTVVCVTLSMTVFFNITTINASGSNVYSSEQILAAVDVRNGDNLLRLNIGRLEERALEQLTSAESVEISRHFPDSLDITVTDGEPSMQIETGGVFYQFTASGRLIGQSQTAVVDAQVVVGPDPSGLNIGQYLSDLTEEQQASFSTWRTVSELIDKYEIHDISAMDLSDDMQLKIFYQNRLEVDMGPLVDMDAKVAALKTILYDTGSIGVEETGVLDLSNADRAYFNNQSACTLPPGAGQLGWSWQDEFSDTLMQSLFEAEETLEDSGTTEEGEDPAASGTTEEGDAAQSESGSDSSETASSEESSDSYATSDGMRLPQMPQIGGGTSSQASSAATSEPSVDTGSSDAASSSSSSSEGTSASSESSASSGLTGAAGNATSGGSTGAGVGSQAPSVPGIG